MGLNTIAPPLPPMAQLGLWHSFSTPQTDRGSTISQKGYLLGKHKSMFLVEQAKKKIKEARVTVNKNESVYSSLS